MKCYKHPRYKGKGKPRSFCEACWRIYFAIKDRAVEPPECPPGEAYRHGGCQDLGVYDG